MNLEAIRPFCDLVLYAVTFNHHLDHDLAALQAYAEFRREAANLGIRHFLEVFNPNAPTDLAPEQVGAFVNDSIVRTLAGVTRAERPVFLKIAYNGADALTELAEATPPWSSGCWAGRPGPPGTPSSCSPEPSGPAAGWRCSGGRSSAPSRSCGWSP